MYAIRSYYAMESGVRGLEREIARCARRIAREAVRKNGAAIGEFRKTVSPKEIEKLLGRKKFKRDVVYDEVRKGVCYGLAWTETGGTILPVETVRFDGSGELILTGNLGDVMKESARTAHWQISSLAAVPARHSSPGAGAVAPPLYL